MTLPEINRISAKIIIGLAFIALLMVLSGYFQPPQTDEGSAAHIFQIAIVLLGPMVLLFLFTADWKQPMQSGQSLAFPAITLLVAFGALYYLEHYR